MYIETSIINDSHHDTDKRTQNLVLSGAAGTLIILYDILLMPNCCTLINTLIMLFNMI